ncbi:MAG: orotidine-5'-phosphate decarboxylase [Deltaproteobacteria bacterium]|nr:orotidine-5'-phosphate decarboxylase [Deltaproteobacteria bacterium]MCL5880815.1 orotidine-5'-phosphate decarboxylase [Deltaproteobacteria bacterium]MDA8304281.1 orotidine-5'-phosphate decarboxylase [Deltaproteobacteria bacterium]
MKNFKERVIIALDYDNLDSVRNILERLKGEAYFYKIGSALFTSCGIQSVKLVRDYGCRIFLDLKFHDIPNTVYNAVKSAGELGADIINIHASGGVDMMKSAKKGAIEAAKKTGKNIDVIAVTILTSLAQEDLRDIFYYSGHGVNSENLKSGNEGNVSNLVLHLAELAKISGLDGVVCSGYESIEIKKVLGDNFKTIVPGIRLKTGKIDDQKRIMTPSAAFNSGADYIVIGREITGADSPADALQNIYSDIEKNALTLK